MTQAWVIGALGSSALVVGGIVGSYWKAPTRVTGVLLAFASGTLLSALSFELFPEAVELGGLGPSAVGLVSGAAVFVVVNTWLDSRVAASAGDPHQVTAPDAVAPAMAGAEADQREKVAAAASDAEAGTDRAGGRQTGDGPASAVGPAIGFALLAAVTLDGVPENLALGVSLLAEQGGSVALLVAIFASNLPEALVGAIAMRSAGRSRQFAIGLWTLTAVLLTLAVVVGYGALATVPRSALSFPLAFAGGAVLASLADTLMPEAFEHGRPLNSFATAAGFFLSFVLAS